MGKITRCGIALSFAVLAAAVPLRGGAAPAPHGEILAAIRENAVRAYRAYDGVESHRLGRSHIYDSRTGELVESSEVLMIRREYFRRRPEFTALRYIKNGVELPPRKFGYRTREPLHLPFDDDNDLNYNERIVGTAVIEGERCHEVEIIPKRKTTRHFNGRAFFAVNGLALRYLEGTLADNPLGVKSLRLRVHFRSLGEAAVIERGEYLIDVHVPILYPHRRIVHSFTSSDDRLIPKKTD
ncbi:MAG TPA: hypothetical protein VLM75_12580 [Spirochaetota bacterium]|nr:hypothetical protein [Spirochaetota bacterium]